MKDEFEPAETLEEFQANRYSQLRQSLETVLDLLADKSAGHGKPIYGEAPPFKTEMDRWMCKLIDAGNGSSASYVERVNQVNPRWAWRYLVESLAKAHDLLAESPLADARDTWLGRLFQRELLNRQSIGRRTPSGPAAASPEVMYEKRRPGFVLEADEGDS